MAAIRLCLAAWGGLVISAADSTCAAGACDVVDEIEAALEIEDSGASTGEVLHMLQVGSKTEDSVAYTMDDVEDEAEAEDEEPLSALEVDADTDANSQGSECRKMPEGNSCVPSGSDPKDQKKMWTHWAYCSGIYGRRYRLGGISSCDSQKGPYSRCKMTGIGLHKAQCDDPFCRTRKDGLHCQENNIVLCEGGEEPKRHDSCSSTSNTTSQEADDDSDKVSVDCTRTDYTECQQDEGPESEPYCAYKNSKTSCDIRRRDSRRRQNCENSDDSRRRSFDDSRRRSGWGGA